MRRAIDGDGKYLKKMIKRTREAIRYTDLPVDRLKDFWGENAWKLITNFEEKGRIDKDLGKAIESLLMGHYLINIGEGRYGKEKNS